MKIKVFADGAKLNDILAAYKAGKVQGFTTNPTLMKQAGVTDYVGFAKSVLAEIKDLPFSFEVFADDFPTMAKQAREIASWGSNAYVKIPVTNTKGESTASLIRRSNGSRIACAGGRWPGPGVRGSCALCAVALGHGAVAAAQRKPASSRATATVATLPGLPRWRRR